MGPDGRSKAGCGDEEGHRAATVVPCVPHAADLLADCLHEEVAVQDARQRILLAAAQQTPLLEPGAVVPHPTQPRAGVATRRVQRHAAGRRRGQQDAVEATSAGAGDHDNDNLPHVGPSTKGDPRIEHRPVMLGDSTDALLRLAGRHPRSPTEQVDLVRDPAHSHRQADPAVEDQSQTHLLPGAARRARLGHGYLPFS